MQTRSRVDVETLAAMYRTMYLIRRVEERIVEIYPSDEIKSPVHLAIGQESVAVGVCQALRPDDVLFGTYRSHAVYLAKGGDLRAFWAELYGKVTGCARGKGGSMHVVDVAHGFMGTSAVVGTNIAQAAGYAYAAKLRRTGQVVVAVFGDGATEAGAFHESLNVAQLRQLPILFVCENNGLAIHSRQSVRQAQDNIWQRAGLYGIPSERLDRPEVDRVHERATACVDEIRRGGGPRFLEVKTYRWRQHVGPSYDWGLGYREESEAEPWLRADELARVRALLEPGRRDGIEREVERAVEDAIEFAATSPFPAPTELLTDVYAGGERGGS
jgi:TPP-dependent pyruvate/acetoin dehydrogenase alpha subunit